MTIDWIDQYIDEIDGIPRPNWEAIYEYVDKNLVDKNQHDLWNKIAHTWMNKITPILSADYSIHESDNFILVTSQSDRYVSTFLNFLEYSLKRILTTLRGITSDDGFGKYCGSACAIVQTER